MKVKELERKVKALTAKKFVLTKIKRGHWLLVLEQTNAHGSLAELVKYIDALAGLAHALSKPQIFKLPPNQAGITAVSL